MTTPAYHAVPGVRQCAAMTPMRKVGRIASIGTSIFVALAFILPQAMTGQSGGQADSAIAGGVFLFCMAAAAMIALGTAIWGRAEARRTALPYEKILLAPLIIVVMAAAMVFGTELMRESMR